MIRFQGFKMSNFQPKVSIFYMVVNTMNNIFKRLTVQFENEKTVIFVSKANLKFYTVQRDEIIKHYENVIAKVCR